MTKLTQSQEIQSFLEDLMAQEEVRNRELKRRIEELSSQLSQQFNGLAQGSGELPFGPTVTLHIGSGRHDKLIRSAATFEDLVSTIQLATGTEPKFVGYRDDQGRLVWIRTNQDVRFAFTWYFSQEVPFLQLPPMAANEVEPIQRFNLRKELNFHEGMVVFRCECAGPDRPLIFIAVPGNLNLEGGMEYLQSVFGPITSLMFVDEAEDVITVDSLESWECCVETASAMSKSGRFTLLLIETT
jgi:hypothetical protein